MLKHDNLVTHSNPSLYESRRGFKLIFDTYVVFKTLNRQAAKECMWETNQEVLETQVQVAG